MTTNGEHSLWLTVRGASPWLLLVWAGWLAFAVILAPLLVTFVEAAGAVLVVLTIGWMLARHLPIPFESLRRYHLDDTELVVMGPARLVRRIAWSDLTGVTQERRSLRLLRGRATANLPLGLVASAGAWGAVLAHVVPRLAEELWARLEDEEEVRLVPDAEPATSALAWWAYLPALAASVVAAGSIGVGVIVLLGICERALAFGHAQVRAVTLHRAGVTLRTRSGSLFVPWAHANITRARNGLLIGVGEGTQGLVPLALPNFWAAAPVIELRQQLGPEAGGMVYFRVRVEGDGLAVVGEIEPTA